LAANGYKGPRTLSPGQQLIIPNAGMAAAPAPVAAAPATRPVASAATSVHVVNHGDTLAGIAHRNHVSVTELARANNLDANAPLKQGARLTVPARTAEAAPVAPQRFAARQRVPTTTIGGPRLAAATPAGQQ